MSWRERFGMSGPPLPRGAAGETFFDQGPHFQRLARVFAWLAAEPGIGVVTGEPGVGKTSAMRHLCRALPQHEHRVVYLADTTVKPLDLYRMLAAELGLRPGPRAQIVGDIKRALVTLVDQRGVVPLIILDDAQALRDEVLHELHALTTLDFDDREYLTIWLVGHPRLDRRLHLQQHAALAQRVVAYIQLSASTDPATAATKLLRLDPGARPRVAAQTPLRSRPKIRSTELKTEGPPGPSGRAFCRTRGCPHASPVARSALWPPLAAFFLPSTRFLDRAAHARLA